MPKSSRGFTLIELLVVISIIAILSAVGLVSYNGIRNNTLKTKRIADLNAIKKAYEANYDPSANGGQGGYKQLTSSNFADGKIPTPDGTANTTYLVNAPVDTAAGSALNNNRNGVVGPNFSACINTQDGSSCTTPSPVCTCVSSNQGTPFTSSTGGPNPSCDPYGVLSQNRAAYWKFDENAGVTVLDSAGSSTGTWHNIDRFERGPSASLGNFNGVTGAPVWNSTFLAGGSFGINASGKAYRTSGVAAAVVDTGSSDGTISVDLKRASGTAAGIIFRAQDVNNYWFIGVSGGAGSTNTLFKVKNGGAPTVVNFSNGSIIPAHPSTDGTKRYEVLMQGNNIKIKVYVYNGTTLTEQFSATTTAANDDPKGTKHGLYDKDGSNNTFDNFLATNFTSAGNWVVSKSGFGTAGNFNNSYVTFPNSSTFKFGTGSFTLSAWVNKSALGDPTAGIISTEGNPRYLFGLGNNPANGVYVLVQGSTGTKQADISCDLGMNAWHLVTLVVDMSSNDVMRLYKDDAQCGSDITGINSLGSVDPTGILQIGRRYADDNPAKNNYFSGIIDDVRIYKKALSKEEISALYNKNSSGVGQGCPD